MDFTWNLGLIYLLFFLLDGKKIQRRYWGQEEFGWGENIRRVLNAILVKAWYVVSKANYFFRVCLLTQSNLPELSFDQQHNESVRRKSVTSSSSPKVVKNSKETPVTPSTVEPPISTFGASSRPVTPTLPSFSQNANVINVTINNNYAGAPEED